MKLLYNKDNFFLIKTELLNVKPTLPSAKLVIAGTRLAASNGLIFWVILQMISS